MTQSERSHWVVVGQVSGLHGLHGWVKLFSHTRPREGIMDYMPLYLQIQQRWQPLVIEEARFQGKGIAVKFNGYDDRDSAAALVDCVIAVRREQLPPLSAGEYYWADLQGLRVVNTDGRELGVVERLFETGANDVVVVSGDRERLIPFVRGDIIVAIDLDQGTMQVDWDADF